MTRLLANTPIALAMLFASCIGSCIVANRGRADSILGEQLSTFTIPSPGAKVLGFRCDVTVGNVMSAGYVPVEISLRGVGVFPADRRLTVRIQTQPEGQAPPRNGLTINLPIVATQGSSVVTVNRYVPKWSAGVSWNVSIWEDGRPLPEYEANIGNRLPANGFRFRQLLPDETDFNSVLVIKDDVATVDTLPEMQSMLNDFSFAYGRSSPVPTKAEDPTFYENMLRSNWMSAIGQSELPTDWRGYNNHDAVLLDPVAIEQVRSNPAGLAALRDFVLVGGIVVVYEAGEPNETLKSLDFAWTDDAAARQQIGPMVAQLEAMQKSEDKEAREELAAIKSHIQEIQEAEKSGSKKIATESPQPGALPTAAQPNGLMYGTAVDGEAAVTIYGELEYWFPTDLENAIEYRDRAEKELAEMRRSSPINLSMPSPDVFMQPVGAGMVIGTTAGINEPDDQSKWSVVHGLFGYRISPMLRRGIDPMIGDRRFDRWLIPGVAQPPVYTFMALLVGFVVLVGPVAYRKTSKSGRSYLMFAIAPLLAMLTTTAMFAYGIVSDGFGTSTRIRQLTFIDGGSGDGAERVRATYFAGIRPSDGIQFPAIAEVMQYPEGSTDSWQDRFFESPSIIGAISIDEEIQRFDSSFLPSRQQCQFILHLPRRGVGHVELVAATEGTPDKIKSTFDFPLRSIVLRNRDGGYWTADAVGPRATIDAKPVASKVATKLMGRMYSEYRPISVTKQAGNRQNYSNAIFDLVLDTNRLIDSQNVMTDGSFELVLQQRLQSDGDIPAGYFIATAEPSGDVICIDEVDTVDSVRYLFGTLP
ncbi:hypothetical protein Poly51_05160 [Rubripirellula tenax]|uniref:Uncharacterized protein n=1 Tax=Rubripirellula tenax TaxID=2528015 RepID=A0A5C6FFG0_9BACT|nr:hypothetical protein [Rubripirellula tenax]TWU60241.1 hypothetical protein Poly51_05160 [Rubripirellula tenax]